MQVDKQKVMAALNDPLQCKHLSATEREAYKAIFGRRHRSSYLAGLADLGCTEAEADAENRAMMRSEGAANRY